MNIIRNNKGQSLLEVIFALFILITGLVATIALIVTSINAGRESINKLVGASLSREGIEIVRNIRDSNWIDPDSGVSWDDGLTGDNTAIPVIDGSSDIILDFAVNDFTDFTKIFLNNGQYVQGGTASGEQTRFYRLIYINELCQDDTGAEEIVPLSSSNDCLTEFGGTYSQVGIRVVSEVRWPSAMSNKKLIIEDRFYNWQIL
ncbi:hypothetical protein KKF61_06435 [Patescibacteria group bacterium]|nr:hypothetical protein [Patescibacteria group bacterium]MBU0964482.1 hypothetical protein [Patescibacteria group bacterium]